MEGVIKVKFKGDGCERCPYREYKRAFKRYESDFCSLKKEMLWCDQQDVNRDDALSTRPEWCPIEIEEVNK